MPANSQDNLATAKDTYNGSTVVGVTDKRIIQLLEENLELMKQLVVAVQALSGRHTYY